MNKQTIGATVLIALFCSTSAWAVNKCVVAGKTVFQDAPCPLGATGGEIEVRPASGKARAVAPPAAAAPQAADALKTGSGYKDYGDKLERERKGRSAWYARRNAQGALDGQIGHCREEQKKLDQEKRYSMNNLAGATRDVSISNQMEAAAALCKLETDARMRELETAKAECSKYECDSLSIAQ
jgi:hypothetical protein